MDTGSGAVVHVRNHAYPIKKDVDYCRVSNFRHVLCTHSSCPFVLVNMAEEEVASFVVVTKVACARLLLLVTHVAAVPSPPEVEPAASIDSAPVNSPGPDTARIFKFTAFS